MRKMYIVVRDDLGDTYKLVQGTHALAQYALEHPDDFKEWNNQTIVFVKVKTENSLHKLVYSCATSGRKFSTFLEPDIDNQLTSVAIFDEEEAMRKYNLA